MRRSVSDEDLVVRRLPGDGFARSSRSAKLVCLREESSEPTMQWKDGNNANANERRLCIQAYSTTKSGLIRVRQLLLGSCLGLARKSVAI